jgi:non-specific serine/threonine protein kinase
MLEAIREFALERLDETGEGERLRQRHAAYFVELAELAKPALEAWRSSIWLDRLEAEHDNIRAVLGDALEHGHGEVALRLAGAAWGFWFARGYFSEGRRWLEEALAGGVEGDRLVRFEAVEAAGLLALWQGDIERGSAAADELQTLASDTDPTRARAVAMAAHAASWRDDIDRAAQLYAASAQLARELGELRLVSLSLGNLGNCELERGEYQRAVELFEENLAIRELQDQELSSRALINLGFTTLLLGDVQRARSLLRDGVTAARELGLMDGFKYGLLEIGMTYAGDDPARAVRLLGRADVLCEETGSEVGGIEGRVRRETEADLRASLGEEAFAAAYAEGRALELEDALALALGPD